jgi:hypothetical protein
MAAIYEKYYKKFEKYLMDKDDRENIDNARRLSKTFAIELRGKNDVYARKYHAFLFSKWCATREIPYPSDWNPDDFWNLQFN